MPTKAELVLMLRAKGLPTKGRKADLEARLTESDTANDREPSPTKKTGVGSAPATPGEAAGVDKSTLLAKGSALSAVVYSRNVFHPTTIRCLSKLKACPYLLQSSAPQDAELSAAMQPVLRFCEKLALETETMKASSSYGVNFRELKTAMSTQVESVFAEFPKCVEDRSIADLFGGFLDAATSSVTSLASHGTTGRDPGLDPALYNLDLQQAIHESLEMARREAVDTVNQMQREIQEFYLAQGGEDVDVDSTNDIPSMEELVNAIPANGATFTELAKYFKIHGHDSEVLVGLQTQLQSHTRSEGSKLYPAPSMDPERIVDDDRVRSIVASYGAAGVDFLDLIKVLKIRDLGVDIAKRFHDDILQRNIVRSNGYGRMALGSGMSAPAQEGRKDSDDPESKQISLTAGQEIPAHPGLAREIARVRHGILAHLRDWVEDFPEPEKGWWPVDFTDKERKKVRSHIAAYVQEKELVTKRDTIETTIQHFLADGNFPVKKAQHLSAIQSAVKELYSEHAKRAKKQARKSQELKDAAAAVAKAGEGDGGNEEEEDDGDDEARDADVDKTTAAATRLSHKRQRSANDGEDEADEGEELARKRARLEGGEESDADVDEE